MLCLFMLCVLGDLQWEMYFIDCSSCLNNYLWVLLKSIRPEPVYALSYEGHNISRGHF